MDSRYRQEVEKYEKKDALLAIGAYLFIFAWIWLTGWAFGALLSAIGENMTGSLVTLLSGAITFIGTAFVFLCILKKKQGLSSIGIHGEKLFPAIRLGLLFSVFPITISILVKIYFDGAFIGLPIILGFMGLIFTAAFEDIFFIGFIQTRLYGLFKRNVVAICVGAAMFSFMHIPFWLQAGLISLEDLFSFGFMVVYWFVLHVVMVAFFKRYFSLFAVTIFHSLYNLSIGYIWIFADEYAEEAQIWILTYAFLSVAVAAGIWALIVRLKRKKAEIQFSS